jgi:hypothetical protein
MKIEQAWLYAKAAGYKAIVLNGKNLIITPKSAKQLEKDGVYFSYIGYCQSHGRYVTIPVND